MNSSWSVSKIDRVLCQFWNIPLLQSHSHRRPDNPKQMRQFVLGQFTLESTFGAYEKKENSLYKPGSMQPCTFFYFLTAIRRAASQKFRTNTLKRFSFSYTLHNLQLRQKRLFMQIGGIYFVLFLLFIVYQYKYWLIRPKLVRHRIL